MEPKHIRKLTDIIYEALFGKNSTALLIYFGLSPLNLRDTDDNAIRDCMGQLALEALSDIEGRCADTLQVLRNVSWEEVTGLVTQVVNDVAIEYKAESARLGVDLLTGEALVRNVEG